MVYQWIMLTLSLIMQLMHPPLAIDSMLIFFYLITVIPGRKRREDEARHATKFFIHFLIKRHHDVSVRGVGGVCERRGRH